jgi:hypothetical protein
MGEVQNCDRYISNGIISHYNPGIESGIRNISKEYSVYTKPKTKLRGLSPRAKLVPSFAKRDCRVVSATGPHDRILGFLDRNRYYFFQVDTQLSGPCSRPATFQKICSTGIRTRTSGFVASNSEHLTTEAVVCNELRTINISRCSTIN